MNSSATIGFTEDAIEDRSGREELILATEDQVFEKGQTVAIPVLIENEFQLDALQATIQYDADKMTFQKIQSANMNIDDSDYAHIGPGSVTFTWMPHVDTPEGRFLFSQDTLFFLQFQIHERTSLSEALFINSTKTLAIAYDGGGNPLNVIWRIHENPHTMEVDVAYFFQLEQNQPNPFSEETTIRFYLKETMITRLEVTGVAGRKTILLNNEMEAGWHEVVLNRNQIDGNGIYFYQLITPYGSMQKRMVAKN